MGVVTEWGRRMRTGTFQAVVWSESLLCGLVWQSLSGNTLRSAHWSCIGPPWPWASRDHAIYCQEMGELWNNDEIARVVVCDGKAI